ncbi:hypothetical protein [Saccharibacillus endophyticus]|uniref:DUF4901 domain-containing protein n=1 Tax=Saccharibacillus endophyticus TaxID=2060666 RepID=A0ABQ1ZLC7_9BACL|nr:hypothetical protein [Saccharibacillus endophyticus]GGH69469.1 hypothetical protein GCM10007362_04560 [Saccharibacillus endophyticus]
MLFKELKETMLIPDREMMLNRLVSIRGADVLLISITSENGLRKLWTLREIPDWMYEEKPDYQPEENRTHRQRMQGALQDKAAFGDQEDSISKMIIQGQLMTFGTSQSTFCTEQDHEAYMKLQHFVEQGMELASFADVRVDRLFLTFYEQDASEPFPDLDSEKELDIALKFNSTSRQISVRTEPIVLEFGDAPKEVKHSFYDPVSGKDRFFYIKALTREDVWKITEENFAKPTPPSSTEEEWQHFKNQYLRGLERACPKGQELAVVEYESEDDIQLALYSEDFLDSKPVSFTSESGDLHFSVFYSSVKLGPDGFKHQTTVVGLIDRTFDGSLVIELVSYRQELPEKTITF